MQAMGSYLKNRTANPICCVHTATHTTLTVRIKPKSNQILSAVAVAQTKLQNELSNKLNSLVYAHLSGPITGCGDSHPTVPNLHLPWPRRISEENSNLQYNFLLNVRLMVQFLLRVPMLVP
ncbi:hypothetical protein DFH28DRAFT_928181 [Melampsora americana]|nr:hypothetical protein DFH28DRAFT_928181 [Melampsora americana]